MRMPVLRLRRNRTALGFWAACEWRFWVIAFDRHLFGFDSLVEIPWGFIGATLLRKNNSMIHTESGNSEVIERENMSF